MHSVQLGRHQGHDPVGRNRHVALYLHSHCYYTFTVSISSRRLFAACCLYVFVLAVRGKKFGLKHVYIVTLMRIVRHIRIGLDTYGCGLIVSSHCVVFLCFGNAMWGKKSELNQDVAIRLCVYSIDLVDDIDCA